MNKIALWWRKFFGGSGREGISSEWEYEAEQEPPVFRRKVINMHSQSEREQYLRSCLEQIASAERELRHLEYEYNMVTSHLTDIEELERTPKKLRLGIEEAAEKLDELKDVKERYTGRESRISDKDFAWMEKVEADVQEGIRKLRETEDYHKLVKSDLKRLSGELHAFEYRWEELDQAIRNAKGLVLICFIASLAAVVVLFVLQMALSINVTLGCVLAVFIAAAVIVKLFLGYDEAKREIVRVEKDINRLIVLQNTVKIRYVNNKNLLDYLCMKFHVKKAAELEALWAAYESEKEERAELERASNDYVYYQKEYLRLLRGARIRDVSVWLHQVGAVLHEQEMMELRQGLVGRRKELRERMDRGKQLATEAQAEVMDLSSKYPRYKEEILGLISEYEEREKKERFSLERRERQSGETRDESRGS